MYNMGCLEYVVQWHEQQHMCSKVNLVLPAFCLQLWFGLSFVSSTGVKVLQGDCRCSWFMRLIKAVITLLATSDKL